jgi:hypothetical protein
MHERPWLFQFLLVLVIRVIGYGHKLGLSNTIPGQANGTHQDTISCKQQVKKRSILGQCVSGS